MGHYDSCYEYDRRVKEEAEAKATKKSRSDVLRQNREARLEETRSVAKAIEMKNKVILLFTVGRIMQVPCRLVVKDKIEDSVVEVATLDQAGDGTWNKAGRGMPSREQLLGLALAHWANEKEDRVAKVSDNKVYISLGRVHVDGGDDE